MSDNVSQSVARAFAVFEMIRQRRKPMTAVELRKALKIPQPSLRALLAKLVELDYLAFDPAGRSYFPTRRLAALGQIMREPDPPDAHWRSRVDGIASATGETTSLSVVRGLDLEVLYACMADHPVALQLHAGRGDALWRSAAGRLLLSAGTAPQREESLVALASRESVIARRREILGLAQLLSDLRSRSWYTAYDLHLKGVGAVCYRTQYRGQTAVIAVAGVKDRIRDNERAIRRAIRAGVR
ncbi:MAG: helix-turn-helix domain-containing protein [Gammaproteobacteria bacterium]